MGRKGCGKVALRNELYRRDLAEIKSRTALESWQELARTLSRLVYGRKYKTAREMAVRILGVGPWYQGPLDTITNDYAQQAQAAYDAWLAVYAAKENVKS